MTHFFGHNYGGYVFFSSAVKIAGIEKWESRVSIAKPLVGQPKNVEEQFFSVLPQQFDSEEEAVSAGDRTARDLIDGVIPGLNI